MTRTLQALDQEWAELADSPGARAALDRWALAEPALAEVTGGLEGILAHQRRPAVFTGMLAALARLAPTDRLAARTILQALLPGLVGVARRSGTADVDAIEEVVSLAWERIRTYPVHRPGPVTGNVLWDVRKAYMRHRALHQPQPIPLHDTTSATDRSPEDVVLEHDFIRWLAETGRYGVAKPEGVRAILATRIGGIPVAEVAAREGVQPQGLKMRRWRAEASLRDHLGLAG